MRNLHKVYSVYGSTGGLLLVLIILTGSLFYVLFGQNFFPQDSSSTPDVVVAGISPGGVGVQVQSGSCDVSTSDLGIDAQEQQAVNLINQYRQANGLSALTTSSTLTRAAAWHARDEATNNYQGHIDSLGRNYDTRIRDCGYTSFATDIAGMDANTDPASIVNAWKSSPDHNLVLLDKVAHINGGAPVVKQWKKIGVGRAFANGKWYWSVDFGVDDDGTSGGGSTGGGSGTGGGVTECSCPNGDIVGQTYPFTGICGQGAYAGTDNQQYTCTDVGWQVIPAGGCINGRIEDAATGNDITKFFLGTNGQGVCGDDGKGYKCNNGSWDLDPQYPTCGRGGGGGGGGTTPPTGGGGGGGGGNTQYSMTSKFEKQQYAPGQTADLCYTLTPATNFEGTLMQSTNNGPEFELHKWQSSSNMCIHLQIPNEAASGPRSFKIIAKINSQQVAQTSASFTVAAASTPPTITGQAATPSATPKPTTIPATITPTATTNITPTATTTPQAGVGSILFSVKLVGIGSNTSSGQIANPQPATIDLQIKLLNPTNGQVIRTSTIPLTYNLEQFKNATTFDSGTYQLKTRTNNSLWYDSGIITVPNAADAKIASIPLVTGDLNQDNFLDMQDYNIFISCYGTRSCSQKATADVNMDGKVTELDLNIFYSGLANRKGD